MEIGTNIKRFRKNHGWTQKDLADKLNTTQKVIHDYESEKTKPPIERLPELAKIFKITVDELLGLKSIELNKNTPRIHKNSRLSKIQSEFSLLTIPEQTIIRKQIRGLLLQRENNKS